MKTTRHEPRPCPWCGSVNTAMTHANGDAEAKVGDVSICIRCARPAYVEADHFRKPTLDEIASLLTNPEVMTLMKVIFFRIQDEARLRARNN